MFKLKQFILRHIYPQLVSQEHKPNKIHSSSVNPSHLPFVLFTNS